MLTERDAYISLNLIRDVGPVKVRLLAEALGSVSAILEAQPRAMLSVEGVGPETVAKITAGRKKADPAYEIEKAAELGAEIITQVDPEYPESLRRIYDPPLALYVRGRLVQRDAHALAIVGSRHTTSYGRECASSFAGQLAASGYTIVSGLARGIDTSAHMGALKAGGRTIAVLGGGLHDIYPPENTGLAGQIAAAGAVITEFPVGRYPDRTTFPIRNRIVSGLSQGVIVVEAGLSSGAMITANMAADQGKSIFAVPGRIDSPTSQGTHKLIKNGAVLMESVADVLDEIGSLFKSSEKTFRASFDELLENNPPLSEIEQGVLKALSGTERTDMDTLVRSCGLPAAAVSSALVMLEMKRIVRMLPGRFVELSTLKRKR